MKPTPTHVEFEDTLGGMNVVPREDLRLHRRDGNWRVYEVGDETDGPGWSIDDKTAARLRRELLGEPPEPAPPVVTGPGVYRDDRGGGWAIAAKDKEGWHTQHDGDAGGYRFADDGTADDYGLVLVDRIADLDAWTMHGNAVATAAELAAMLAAASKPAAEPEFVPWRYGVIDRLGFLVGSFPQEERTKADDYAGQWNSRVVPLFIRREDAT